MKAKQILFKRYLAEQIREGLKTETRRCGDMHRNRPHKIGQQLYVRYDYYQTKAQADLLIRITDHWLERLQEITEDGAKAEGFDSVLDFAAAWNRINGANGLEWSRDPVVRVYRFEVLATTHKRTQQLMQSGAMQS